MKLKPGAALNIGLSFARERTLAVGRLALEGETALLEYSANFLTSGLTLNPVLGPPTVGLVEPRKGTNARNLLHGFIAESLPDAWGDLLMRRMCEKQGIAYGSLTLLDKLGIVGRRGPGALVYDPTRSTSTLPVDLDKMAHAADRIIAGKESAALDELANLGGSSGGARPKILVGMNDAGRMIAPGNGDLPDDYEGWLVKFRSRKNDSFEDIGPLECAYADMAREGGIDVSQTRLIPSAHGPGYFATKRFDRTNDGGRLHFVSAAGLLDIDWDAPSMDYNDLMKLSRHVVKTQESVERIFARMAFNVLAHNRDDHGKQHGYLMDADGRWTLAPAYDLTHSQGYNAEHYLAVKGKGGDDIPASLMIKLGDEHGIAKAVCTDTLERVADAVSRFGEFAGRYDVSRPTTRAVASALEASLSRMAPGAGI